VGSVIRVSTIPPVRDDDLGIPKKFKKMARPRRPNIIDGTAARLLIFTSIISVRRFSGANSSRYTAVAAPIGKDSKRVMIKVKKEPEAAPRIPASSGSRESSDRKKSVLNFS
jgi:hypothetical protein